MAQFTNQAQLSYNNTVVNSNIVTGEILEVLSATKTAVLSSYSTDDSITYVISAVNAGTSSVSGVSVSDDLGAYEYNGETLYPLTYTDGSARLYINGVLQAAPAVSAGPPLVFSGITIPANSNMILIYEAQTNQFSPLSATDSIVNTATISGVGIPAAITAEETVFPQNAPELTITKYIEPSVVTENGTLTYTFIIQNYGNTDAAVTDNVSVTDTFDPVLQNIAVSLNGVPLTENTQYTYNAASGVFTTLPSVITVPAATYTRDTTTGAITIDPGTATLTVTGTI
ncbi:MAG: hypothetical protein IKT65_07480 [Clostridia bacterium]|nr:hypothetical protein [Clostridia bacterium]